MNISSLWRLVEVVLGLGVQPQDMLFRHMAARCVVVFVAAVIVGRLADRRAFGQNAAFDMMLAVVLGSVLSRAINGHAAFFPTLGVGVVLVMLHRLLAMIAVRWHWFSRVTKGSAVLLVKNGRKQGPAMLRYNITSDDLLENLRLSGNLEDIPVIAEAWLERNGRISVVPRPRG